MYSENYSQEINLFDADFQNFKWYFHPLYFFRNANPRDSKWYGNTSSRPLFDQHMSIFIGHSHCGFQVLSKYVGPVGHFLKMSDKKC